MLPQVASLSPQNLEPSLRQAPWRAIPVAPQHSGWGRPHLEDVDVKVRVGQQGSGDKHAGQG